MNMRGKYSCYALVREMMETVDIIKNFKLENAGNVVETIKNRGKLFLTGEGSSRIFPAKNAIYSALRAGLNLSLTTEGGLQSGEYDLNDFVVFGASNSGQTKELIWLFNRLKKINHKELFAITANKDTKLESLANQTFVLSCGKENAVAATKSVAGQALVYQSILAKLQGKTIDDKLNDLADAVNLALTMKIDNNIVKTIAGAGTIYFAGRNNGVAEELTLKTNEITRKKSDYLEGTYAVHGIEEVMNPDDVVILVNPFKTELEKIQKTLVEGVGLKVIAIYDEDTVFPTIKIKDIGELTNYVYLAAGWNILVEVGISLGVDLDKPVRARKVGNEFTG